jgi:hypothetical protein
MRLRPAFTLFELILAIALSATLLALIGTAVNLYLVRMDSGRTRVEEAQLARSILSTIAADVRATTVYQTQDISTVEQLAAASKVFDPDAIDQQGAFQDSGLGSPVAPSTPTSPDSEGGSQSSTTTMAPGLNGLVDELMLDVVRLPRLDELYPAVPQQTSTLATAAANATRPSDLKTVRYFIRQGAAIDPSDRAATLLSPEAQQGVGGLVRQTIDRAIRQVAEQAADAQLLNSGQMLLAPEVTQIQFVYFDGTTAVDTWDMQERSAMPTAIDVRIWIAPDAVESESSEISVEPHMYSQTIELPLAQAAEESTTAAGSQAGASDDGTTGDSSSEGFGSELTE